MTIHLLGHRGAAGEAPENTLAGFTLARNLGVTGIELDVHLSADGVLVVIHDDTLERTTNARGPVSALTSAELQALEARAAFPQGPERVGVPTLGQVLEAVPDFALYHLEIKRDATTRYETVCRQLATTAAEYGVTERALAISFDPQALAIMREVAPEIRRGFLGGYANQSDVETAVSLDCEWACMSVHTASGESLAAAQDRGLRLSMWTCNTSADFEAALTAPAEAFCSDVPTQALAYLRQRGVTIVPPLAS
ncbi:MAG: hypothetical protein GX100_09155 [candidate division WS1 bacterium]|jgi:glycerophosphoryl diester phosphodiesterase|nr:hypothetical protein [candidate division WS1 bacterium]